MPSDRQIFPVRNTAFSIASGCITPQDSIASASSGQSFDRLQSLELSQVLHIALTMGPRKTQEGHVALLSLGEVCLLSVINFCISRKLARRRRLKTTYTLPIVFSAACVSWISRIKKPHSWDFKIALGKTVHAV